MASQPEATAGSLFAGLPPIGEAGEQFVQLVQRSGLLIERIVSSGQASPAGFWYDQPEAEWVLLLQGEALLRFADEDQARRLQAGDWLDIAAHRRHRVEWTAPDRLTIWLTVFYGGEGGQPAEAGRQRCEAATECLRPGWPVERSRRRQDGESGMRQWLLDFRARFLAVRRLVRPTRPA